MGNEVLFPGDTLGIIGDSSNGIRLAQTAKRLGFKVIIYATNEGSPTLADADVKIVGDFSDKAKLQDFAERCDLVMYESEHISSEVIAYLQKFTKVPQGSETLEIVQDRLLERAFFEQMNINIAPYATIVSLEDVYQAVSSIGYPCVLKPIQKGFGPKRQQIIRKQTDIAKCADIIDMGTYILESWIPYNKELSVIMTRDYDGNLAYFPVIETRYKENRLNEAIVPANIQPDVEEEVKRLAGEIVSSLKYVGALEVAFYLTESGSLYVKRIVPALHNSGYVFDKATNVSMFEQHLRTLVKMPLVDIKLVQPAGMVMIEEENIDDIRTQWVLKNNWYYTFFRYPESMRPQPEGYIIVLAESEMEIKQQIESTGIWDDLSKE